MKTYLSITAVVLILFGVAVGLQRLAPQVAPQEQESGENEGVAEEDQGGAPQGILPFNSGVSGTVYVGPACPTMRMPPDPSCADKPLETTIEVYPAHITRESPFAVVTSDKDGRYRVVLPPGDYILSAKGKDPFPRCEEKAVTVGPDTILEENLLCDTGVR